MNLSIAGIRSFAPLVLGFFLLLVAAASAVFVFRAERNASLRVERTLEAETALDRVVSLVRDAETGQRGYLLTGLPQYLAPYAAAQRELNGAIETMAREVVNNKTQRAAVAALRPLVAEKMSELQRTVDLKTAGNTAAATAIVSTGRGKALMDRIRAIVSGMQKEEQRSFKDREAQAVSLADSGQTVLIACIVLVLAIAGLTFYQARHRLIALERANMNLAREAAEREAVENQLHQMQKMEAIGQLTGGVAHDFNNMLAIIIGSLSMARRRLTGDEHPSVARNLDNANEGAQRAATLTARLLAFSRQQPLEPRPLDANKLVGGMSELLRRTLGEPIEIETVLAGGLWRTLADPGQLESSILNLAVNARDAMPGGGKLTIETGNADLDERYARAHSEVAPGQYVLISVTDTGEGMKPDVAARAFDPFFTTKGVGRGTGLGLSQVYGFVKQSGGHVKIYSEVAQGTTIKVYLPRYRGDGKAEPVGSADMSMPSGSPDEIILVVEDDENVRRMTIDALRELGYGVVDAALPSEALAKLDQHPDISLLFTDVVMPEMSGRELAERIVSIRPGLRTLYTTGYTRNAVVHSGIVDAGTSFLPKPFTVEQLAHKVRQALDMA